MELAHQLGARLRWRYWTVKDPFLRAAARARALFHDSDPEVVAYSDRVDLRNKRNFSKERVLKVTVKKEEREAKRVVALMAYQLRMGSGINGGAGDESADGESAEG